MAGDCITLHRILMNEEWIIQLFASIYYKYRFTQNKKKIEKYIESTIARTKSVATHLALDQSFYH